MTGPSYPAARGVAPTVYDHFARHLAEARERGEVHVAAIPDAAAIETMVDAAFWASLRREESYIPKISLAFLTPDQTEHPLVFEHSLPLDAGGLVRLAPAVERPGIHLGVSRDGDNLIVWGTAQTIPPLCLVIEVAAPGLLVVKHHRGEETAKYLNVAVLEGDQVKIVDEQAPSLPIAPRCSRRSSASSRLRSIPTRSTCSCSWPCRCGRTDAEGSCSSCRRGARPGSTRSCSRFTTPCRPRSPSSRS